MDWNADGLKDLLVGEYNGNVRHYRNIGTVGNPVLTYVGLIQVGGVALDAGDYSTPWTNDWNQDGLIDLLVGASDGKVRLYINVGSNANPTFNTTGYVVLASAAQLDVGDRSFPNVEDMNGDGIKDLISGEINGKVYYYQNNGTNQNPALANGVYLYCGSLQFSTPGTSRTAPVDWDNDGDLDLIVGSYDARLKRFMQVATTPPAPSNDLANTGSYIIPAAGGTLHYSFSVTNGSSSTVSFDAWTEVQMPNYGGWYGPLFTRDALSLGPGGYESRNLVQSVPAAAPTGYYYLYGYVGDYQNLQIYSQDYVYFYKTTTAGYGAVGDWNVTGWEEAPSCNLAAPQPDKAALNASPNPFNPTTTLSFSLPAGELVNLTIFNTSGQKVATLVDGFREAGSHQVTWEAQGMPAGVYLLALNAGKTQAVEKIFLLK